ncbi:hypothetical protein EBR16_00955, partial [bacterium]|nr:hypothetical protein [bacterium]
DVPDEIEVKYMHKKNLFDANLALKNQQVDLGFVMVRRASARREEVVFIGLVGTGLRRGCASGQCKFRPLGFIA